MISTLIGLPLLIVSMFPPPSLHQSNILAPLYSSSAIHGASAESRSNGELSFRFEASVALQSATLADTIFFLPIPRDFPAVIGASGRTTVELGLEDGSSQMSEGVFNVSEESLSTDATRIPPQLILSIPPTSVRLSIVSITIRNIRLN